MAIRTAEIIAYHEASKHRLDRYAPGPGRLDWANQPDPFRTYAGAPRTELPLRADGVSVSFERVRQGERGAPARLERDTVALMLELSLGLSAWKEYGGSRWALRCNPSSGNLHPTEAYVVCPEIPGLSAGVHHYVSRDHALEQRAAPAPAVAADGWRWGGTLCGGVLFALTGIHWREAWKYGLRAWRYCQHDCGHAIAALAYAAAVLGWHTRALSWADDELGTLLGLDRAEDFAGAEHESPEAVLWVGAHAPDPAWTEPRPPSGPLAFAGRANRLSRSRVAWPGIEQVDAAARRPRGAVAPGSVVRPDASADASLPKLAPSDVTASLPQLAPSGASATASRLIRQRRSAVAFDGVTRLAAARWFAMLDALLPRPGVPPLDAWASRPRVHPMLFAHRIEGVAPGLYALVRDADALPRLRDAMKHPWEWSRVAGAPAHLPLHRLTEGDGRDAARTIACHQDIAADSCFALGFVVDFAATLDAAPWAYRDLFRETGVLGQILYLEAEAAGVRATGIGCFFDDSMHELLGLDGTEWQSLYHFTVGGPIEDHRLQTHPPYAHLGTRESAGLPATQP